MLSFQRKALLESVVGGNIFASILCNCMVGLASILHKNYGSLLPDAHSHLINENECSSVGVYKELSSNFKSP